MVILSIIGPRHAVTARADDGCLPHPSGAGSMGEAGGGIEEATDASGCGNKAD
jgi:hypothetical protein